MCASQLLGQNRVSYRCREGNHDSNRFEAFQIESVGTSTTWAVGTFAPSRRLICFHSSSLSHKSSHRDSRNSSPCLLPSSSSSTRNAHRAPFSRAMLPYIALLFRTTWMITKQLHMQTRLLPTHTREPFFRFQPDWGRGERRKQKDNTAVDWGADTDAAHAYEKRKLRRYKRAQHQVEDIQIAFSYVTVQKCLTFLPWLTLKKPTS